MLRPRGPDVPDDTERVGFARRAHCVLLLRCTRARVAARPRGYAVHLANAVVNKHHAPLCSDVRPPPCLGAGVRPPCATHPHRAPRGSRGCAPRRKRPRARPLRSPPRSTRPAPHAGSSPTVRRSSVPQPEKNRVSSTRHSSAWVWGARPVCRADSPLLHNSAPHDEGADSATLESQIEMMESVDEPRGGATGNAPSADNTVLLCARQLVRQANTPLGETVLH